MMNMKYISFLIDCFMSVIAARKGFWNMGSAIHTEQRHQRQVLALATNLHFSTLSLSILFFIFAICLVSIKGSEKFRTLVD